MYIWSADNMIRMGLLFKTRRGEWLPIRMLSAKQQPRYFFMDVEIKKLFEVITNNYAPAKSFQDATHRFSTQDISTQINAISPAPVTQEMIYNAMVEMKFLYDIIPSTLEWVWLLKERK